MFEGFLQVAIDLLLVINKQFLNYRLDLINLPETSHYLEIESLSRSLLES